MKAFAKWGVSLAIIGTVLLGGLIWWRHTGDSAAPLIKDGNVVIAKIESFRQVHGRPPKDLSEVGVSTDGPLYYEIRHEGYYVIWYGKGFESLMHDSREKGWKTVN